MPTTTRSSLQFWATPAVAVVIGLGYLVAAWLGGQPVLGVIMLAIMLAAGAAFVLAARRSETVRGLMDHRDERLSRIDLTATATAGAVMIVADLVGFAVELARGQDGLPYSWLGAVAGLTYVVAVAVLRIRG